MVAKGKVLQGWTLHRSQTTLSTSQSPLKMKYHWLLFLQPAKTLVIWPSFYWAWKMQQQNEQHSLLFPFVFQPLHCFSQAGRFLSEPRYPGQLLGNGKTTQTSQERRGRSKGWEWVVLYLPFPGGLVMVWGGSLLTQVSFSVNLASSILQHNFKHS